MLLSLTVVVVGMDETVVVVVDKPANGLFVEPSSAFVVVALLLAKENEKRFDGFESCVVVGVDDALKLAKGLLLLLVPLLPFIVVFVSRNTARYGIRGHNNNTRMSRLNNSSVEEGTTVDSFPFLRK